jgi:hypothetical protein
MSEESFVILHLPVMMVALYSEAMAKAQWKRLGDPVFVINRSPPLFKPTDQYIPPRTVELFAVTHAHTHTLHTHTHAIGRAHTLIHAHTAMT